MIVNLILKGRFAEAEAAFTEGPAGSFDAIIDAAYDRPSTLFYAFIAYLIARHETPERHYMASRLMSSALCHLPDGYATALYHSRQCLALDPSHLDCKKDMLLFYDIPERLLTRAEAAQIADEVLGEDPNHEIARTIAASTRN